MCGQTQGGLELPEDIERERERQLAALDTWTEEFEEELLADFIDQSRKDYFAFNPVEDE